jgi:outer membrane receptor protein involved in Fe transport
MIHSQGKPRGLVGLRITSFLCAIAPSPLFAQEPPETQREQPQIVVTGERVARTLKETPSSVVVMDTAEIDANSADRLDQILALVPNVQLGSGEQAPSIRGQDSTGLLRGLFAFLGGSRPRLTLQIDGRAVSYNELISSSEGLWDVDRVEVFRSPQTTTQGRNSIAGAIFIETRDPTFEWQGAARLIAGTSGTGQASGVVSGPIVDGQLAFRASADVRTSRASTRMVDRITGVDIDRDDYGTARLKLLYQPVQLPGLRLETTYVHSQSQAPQFEGVGRPFERRRLEVPERMIGVMRVNVDSLTARAVYALTPTLTSTTTLSGGDVLLQRYGLPGLGRTRAETSDRSIESTLRWAGASDLSVQAGVNRVTTRQRQSIDIVGLGIGTGVFADRQGGLGLFGEATWRAAPRLTLTAGARYERDTQTRRGKVGPIELDYQATFSAFLPKVSLAYDLDDDVAVGLLVQRAFNPGGTSISFLRRAADTFEAERLMDYELFARGRFGGGRGSFSANLFYNDIEDAQRPQLVAVPIPGGGTFLTPEYANAPEARSYGLETEVSWRFGSALWVRGAAGLLRTKVVTTTLPQDPIRGKRFERAPGLSLVAAADWRPLTRLKLSSQLRHHSAYFSDGVNTPALRIPASTNVDARASVTLGKAEAFAYVRNLFDSFRLAFLYSGDLGVAEDPREFGVGMQARF